MIDKINTYLWMWKASGICQLRLCKTGKCLTLKCAHPASFLYAAALILGTIGTCIQEFLSMINTDAILMTKSTVMFSVNTACVMCSVVSGIASSVHYRNRFLKVLLDLENVERHLQRYKNPNPTQLPKFMKLSHVLVWSTMLATLGYDWYAWFMVWEQDFRLSFQFMYITHLIIITMILKFTFVVLHIREQFATINNLFVQHLNFIYDPPPTSHTATAFNHTTKSKLMTRNLTDFLSIHDSLYQIIAETSVVFGPENLMSLMFIMEQLVCCPFYSIASASLFNTAKEGTKYFISLYFIWMCAFLVLLVVMVYACSIVKDEASKLKKIVSWYMNPLKTNYPNDYIHLYMMKLNKPYTGFSVFGFLELELPLARDMIAAAVTYLVIFLQF